MTEKLLHGANVVPVLEQRRREAVAKNVRTDALGEPRPTHRGRNLLLNHRLVEMKAGRGTPLRIPTHPRGGKHKLPRPVR